MNFFTSFLQNCNIYFLPLLGVFYLLAKITIKYVVRNLGGAEFDLWEIISWFSVDLSILDIALSISLKAHTLLQSKLKIDYEGIVFWYLFLAAVLGICICSYGYVTKLRQEESNIMPKIIKTGSFITFSWFTSASFFVAIIILLKN